MDNKIQELEARCSEIELQQSQQGEALKTMQSNQKEFEHKITEQQNLINRIAKKIRNCVRKIKPERKTRAMVRVEQNLSKKIEETCLDNGIEATDFYKEEETNLKIEERDVTDYYHLVAQSPTLKKEVRKVESMAEEFNRLQKKYNAKYSPDRQMTTLDKKKALQGILRRYPCWIRECEWKLSKASLLVHIQEEHPQEYFYSNKVTRSYSSTCEYGDKIFMECLGELFRVVCWIYLNGEVWFWCEVLGHLQMGNRYKCRIELLPQREGQKPAVIESLLNRHIEIEQHVAQSFIHEHLIKYTISIEDVERGCVL